MSASPTVSVLVISYNTREMTLECLRSVFDETTETRFELIVIDNASSDGSAEAIEREFDGRIQFVRSNENLGFARANNVAAEYATGELLLLLNPDTVVIDGAIDQLVAFAKCNTQNGIWGGRTIFADGSLNFTSCWMSATPWSLLSQAVGLARLRGSRAMNPEQPDAWTGERPASVDIVSGCFLLIQRSLWQKLDGFDESFFMYGEEADLCLRACEHGARPMVTDDAVIIHHGGASEAVRSGKLMRLLHAKYRLCRRHWKNPTFAALLVALWPATRLVALTLLSPFNPKWRADRRTWREVWAARRRWLENAGGFDPANP